MATKTKDEYRTYELGDISEYPMVATDIIYEGSAVGLASGLARPLVAGDTFVGFCEQQADNSAGAASAINVRTKDRGKVIADVVGVTGVTNVGTAVYMSDDNVFTLTSTSNSLVGMVTRYNSGTECVVSFKSAALAA